MFYGTIGAFCKTVTAAFWGATVNHTIEENGFPFVYVVIKFLLVTFKICYNNKCRTQLFTLVQKSTFIFVYFGSVTRYFLRKITCGKCGN